MRTIILYHPKDEFAGLAQDYKRDYETKHPGQKIELVSLDEVEGSEMAKLYDIVRYPAILVVAKDGSLQKMWQDRPFPLLDEVASYSRA
jgi:thiol-disulfide isomerase/thioredoxin